MYSDIWIIFQVNCRVPATNDLILSLYLSFSQLCSPEKDIYIYKYVPSRTYKSRGKLSMGCASSIPGKTPN